MNDDPGELRQARLHFSPDPPCKIFARRILEAVYFVQVLVIETLERWLESRAHIGKIHDPPGMCVDVARDVQLDAKGMSVQARALVARRDIGKPMGGFNGERAKDLHRFFRE
jgi:hypothetical protein